MRVLVAEDDQVLADGLLRAVGGGDVGGDGVAHLNSLNIHIECMY